MKEDYLLMDCVSDHGEPEDWNLPTENITKPDRKRPDTTVKQEYDPADSLGELGEPDNDR